MKLSEKVMRNRSEALLIALLGKNMAPKWWFSPNKAFEDKTPEEHWKENPEDVYDYLMHYASN